MALQWSPLQTKCFAQEISAVDAFKEFLSRPPSIQEISFAMKSCATTNDAALYSGSINGPDFFIRRYLPGEDLHAFLSPSNLMGFPYFVGTFGEKRWEISGLVVHETEEATNVFASRGQNGRRILNGAVTFGIPAIAGTFKWNGNRFTAEASGPIPDGFPNTVSGEITVSNGYPIKADCQTRHVTIYFDFTNSLPAGVPSLAVICGQNFPREKCAQTIQIIRLLATSEWSETHFSPYRHIATNYLGITRYAGTNQYVVKNNTYALLKQFDRRAATSVVNRKRLIIGFFVVTFLVALPLVVLFLHNKRTHREKS